MRFVLFWDITQLRVVCRWDRYLPLKVGPTGFPETSVRYYHCTLHNIPEQRWSQDRKHEYMFNVPEAHLDKSNETPTWCNTVQVLFLQSHSTCFGHKPPALIRRCDDLPTTITHVPVAAVLVLNTPDAGRLRPKHVEWPCRNKTCTVLHQVGVSFDLYYDARKHKIKMINHMLFKQISNSSTLNTAKELRCHTYFM